MFFKKQITREPEFFEFEYQNKEFKNKYIIEAGNIISAYNDACELTKAQTESFDSIEIQLKNDVYEISEPIILDKKPESELPIIFSSEKSLISGGKSFKGGFTPCGNGIYKRGLPEINGFRQLYADGKLLNRCCFPKHCESYKNEYVKGKLEEDKRAIFLPVKLDITDVSGILEIIVIEKWTCSVVKIKSFEQTKKGTLFYLDDESASLFYDEKRSTRLDTPMCRIENSLDLLTDENDWYFDRAEKVLYFKPKSGADINNIEFTVPVSEKIIEIKTDNIYFNNISFGYSNWDYPSIHGFMEVQGTRYIDKTENGIVWSCPTAAVSVYSKNIHFDKCKIINTGAAGISLYEGAEDFSITNSIINSTCAGGISVGSFDEKIPSQKNIVIANNKITQIGRNYLGGVGILAGYTQNLIIDRNTVSDCGYTGISVGWGWGKENDMGNFKITNNHVSDIINNYLFDGAGLYLLGRQSSDGMNLISGNYLEGGSGYAGLYFDECSNNYDAHDNVIMSGRKNGWFLLIHDVNYGTKNINIKHNLIETKKKHINSYAYPYPVTDIPINKKSSHESRNVIIENNYTLKFKGFEEVKNQIITHSGAKN